MKVGSLFSGTAALDRGVTSVIGGDVAWFCDYDTGPSKLLAYRHPHIPNLRDVTTVDWTAVEPVDVITGGFPCQDVSLNGLRAGITPDSRSGLWSHMHAAIRTIRPRLVVIENVRGLLSAEAHSPSDLEPDPWSVGDRQDGRLRALGAVLGDLADVGYDAWWTTLRAADAGAPHSRARVFVFAWPATSDPKSFRQSAWSVTSGEEEEEPVTGGASLAGQWGPYRRRVEGWEQVTDRSAPDPADERGRANPRAVEWLMGLPDGYVTDVPGLSRREQLKLMGNGVVEQQAALATRMWLESL